MLGIKRLDFINDQRFFVIRAHFIAWWFLVALMLARLNWGGCAFLLAPLVTPLSGASAVWQSSFSVLGAFAVGANAIFLVAICFFLRRPSRGSGLLLHAAVFSYWLYAAALILQGA